MSLLDKASLVITPNATKVSKLYSVIPSDGSGDMTVVRATTATRINSNGLIESVALNVPRIDYTDSTCPSVLVEPQRTNILTYSNLFSDASWSKGSIITVSTSSEISPDGTLNAYKVNANGTGNTFLRKGFTTTAGTTYTSSFFIKKGNSRYVGIRGLTNVLGNDHIIFDFDTNSLILPVQITSDPEYIGYSFKIIGNGWVNVSYSLKPLLSEFRSIGIAITDNIGSETLTLSNQFCYLFGGQLEQGSYATSYIPTVASAVTRNADVISKTGISSLIGQTEGTIFIDANIIIGSTTRYLLDVQDGTNNNSFQFSLNNSNILSVFIYNGGVAQALLDGEYCVGRKKIALGYKNNDFVLYVNGVQKNSATSGIVPSTSLLTLGSLYFSTGFELGNGVNSTQLYKTRLTNAELATLTTL